jgi:hypothetical protein
MSVAEDKLEIMELCHRYAELIDTGHMDRLAAEIFTGDAVIDYGTGEVEGTEAIAAFFAPFSGHLEATSHHTSNFIMEVDGDTAHGTHRNAAWHWHADTAFMGPVRPADFLIMSGYRDEYRRTADGWRVSHRLVYNYGPGGLAFGRPPASFVPMFEGMNHLFTDR